MLGVQCYVRANICRVSPDHYHGPDRERSVHPGCQPTTQLQPVILIGEMVAPSSLSLASVSNGQGYRFKHNVAAAAMLCLQAEGRSSPAVG